MCCRHCYKVLCRRAALAVCPVLQACAVCPSGDRAGPQRSRCGADGRATGEDVCENHRCWEWGLRLCGADRGRGLYQGPWSVSRPVVCIKGCGLYQGPWSVSRPVVCIKSRGLYQGPLSVSRAVVCIKACGLYQGLWSVSRAVVCVRGRDLHQAVVLGAVAPGSLGLPGEER